MNVSEQLLQMLIDLDVKYIHGVTGDALNSLVTAVSQQKIVQWRGYKYEGNAAFAAFGESQASGKLAVCAGTVGPGALHLINGLYNAKKERTPVVAITGQVNRVNIGTNYFQEVDLQKVFDDVCTYQAIVRTPEEAPRVMMRALQIAVSQRTTCRIEIPADIAQMKAQNLDLVHPIFYPSATLVPNTDSVQQAADYINNSGKITILAGAGCKDAKDLVLQLSEKLKAPIVHTFRASEVFPQDTPGVVGLTGKIGNPSGYHATSRCDLLIMLGTDFPYSDYLPHHTATIQVDTRAENLGNRTAVDVGVQGDIGAFIQQVLPLVEERDSSHFRDKLVEAFQRYMKHVQQTINKPSHQTDPLKPQSFFHAINSAASDDAIFITETGTSAIWAASQINYHGDRRLIGSFNHGSMAVGMPAAMGAQMAFPDRQVWAFSGDGAFNMVLADFITAVRYKLPIKVLVLNNQQLDFVKLEMEEAGLRPTYDVLYEQNVNFADYARLCGGAGARVEKAEDILPAIEQASNSELPFIIDAVVNPGELHLPPHITAKQALGFGESKIKEIGHMLLGNKDDYNDLVQEMESLLSNL